MEKHEAQERDSCIQPAGPGIHQCVTEALDPDKVETKPYFAPGGQAIGTRRDLDDAETRQAVDEAGKTGSVRPDDESGR
jgi:hypothetical protein